MRIGFFKFDRLIKATNYIGIPIFIIYAFSMFIFPFLNESSWNEVQEVWDRWQALNVGMLAFISSLIAFNISKSNSDRQTLREFTAAKAFLPMALSELCDYFKKSAKFLLEGWGGKKVDNPRLPESYKKVFTDCIRYAPPEVGDYLSNILNLIQVHHARMRGLEEDFQDNIYRGKNSYLIDCMVALAELQALVNKIFSFSRNNESFKVIELSIEDYSNSYACLGISSHADEIYINEKVNLNSKTEQKLSK